MHFQNHTGTAHCCNICHLKFSSRIKLIQHQSVHKNNSKQNTDTSSTSQPANPSLKRTSDTPLHSPSSSKRPKSTKRRKDYSPAMRLKKLRPPVSSIIKTEIPLSKLFISEDLTDKQFLENCIGNENSPARGLILQNRKAIKTHVVEPTDKNPSRFIKYCSRYNIIYEETDGKNTNPAEIIQEIFNRQKRCFKINFSYNFLLQENNSGVYRFFHADRDSGRVLRMPIRISNQTDVNEFVKKVESYNPWIFAGTKGDTTVWKVRAILSTTYYVTPLLEFPIGYLSYEDIPQFLRAKHSLEPLVKNKKTGLPYNDDLCFFRCVAIHFHPNKDTVLEKEVKVHRLAIKGDIDLAKLPDCEECFKLNINVFNVDSATDTIFPDLRSSNSYTDVMNVLFYQNHFMYIKNINKLQLSFSCQKCNAIFGEFYNFKVHDKKCKGEITQVRYKGGVYQPGNTCIERLHKCQVNLPQGFLHPFRITYDFESYFHHIVRKTDKTSYNAEHKVLSVSVCSNVPGFKKPKCIVTDGNTQKVINEFGDYMDEIRLQAITEMNAMAAIRDAYESVEENEIGKAQLDEYLNIIPVVGFNSGRYDLNLCKNELLERFVAKDLRYIEEQMALKRAKTKEVLRKKAESEGEVFELSDDEEGFTVKVDDELGPSLEQPIVVKKANTFLTIRNSHFVFLDIINFIAPGFNYANYLKAYKATAAKGVFPYEYFDNLDKLNETELPSQKAFHSSLRNKDLSDEDYTFVCDKWKTENMTTLRDLLIWYNNLDVQPFLIALQNQIDVFSTEFHMDMLKDGWTIPALTMKYLFKSALSNKNQKWIFFSLPENKEADYHALLREQMVGGPSIVFTRHHEKDVTRIRDKDGKSVQICAGYDANALYLWAMMQFHPTDFPIKRFKEEGFKKKVVRRYGRMCREWLEWVKYSENKYIQHQFNNVEKQFGPYRVDGWDGHNVVYEFNGCAFHGHLIKGQPCRISLSNTTHPYDKNKTRETLYAETCKKFDYLESKRLTVISKWECEWDNNKKENDGRIEKWLELSGMRFKSIFEHEDLRNITINENLIEHRVKSGKFFGLIRCDIHTPEKLKSKFSEFPPIFKNVTISKNDIGDHMKTYCEEVGCLKQPRKSLISSYFGKDVVLTSPLLQWYLRQGLIVSNITELYEYKPVKCFESFGNKVTENRRLGDREDGDKITADTYKLVGNSSYGKTLENIGKRTDNKYLVGDPKGNEKRQLFLLEKVEREKRHKNFMDITELSDTLFEVKAAKRSIEWNLPHQVGFFVYQYAKLKMLSFYHECLCEYIDKSNFELIEMDTDSLYMALSTTSLDEAVMKEKRHDFFSNRHRWFPAEACNDCRENYIKIKTLGQPWIQKTCCRKKQKYDKRTPGLMKLEWSGSGCIALCSKSYICFGSNDGTGDKLATKGVNKHLNPYAAEHFLDVLETGTPKEAENRGFRTNKRFIETYKQNKIGLTYVYVKRKVLEDGIKTVPLDL